MTRGAVDVRVADVEDFGGAKGTKVLSELPLDGLWRYGGMMWPVIFAIGVVVMAVPLVLVGEWRQRPWLGWVAKPIASMAFLTLGVLRFDDPNPFAAWMVVGLGLCAVGDVALLGGRKAFVGGLVTFLLGHVAYVVAFSQRLAPNDWPLPLLAPVLAASVLAARWLWPHVGELKPAVAAYIAVISVMVWGGLCLLVQLQLGVIAVAGVLFYVSDLFVARQRFVRAQLVNRMIGLPLYYAAQLLFAFTVGVP